MLRSCLVILVHLVASTSDREVKIILLVVCSFFFYKRYYGKTTLLFHESLETGVPAAIEEPIKGWQTCDRNLKDGV